MSTQTRDCERAGRAEGLAAGLSLALAGFDIPATAPGRYAAVPARLVPSAKPVVTHSLAGREDIVFVDCAPPPAAPDVPATPDVPDLTVLGQRLAAARLGLTRRLLDTAVEHLTGRFGGGEPLIRKQLVLGTVADVIATIELLREYTTALPDGTAARRAAVADLHERITDLDWQVIRLFGAAGYIADHPVRALYVSALVANTWIPAGGDQ